MQEKGGDIMNFAERLRQARIKRGYTQQQIADKMGITNSTYCGYETGKRQPDVAKIKQLANILNVSGDELLGTEFINDKIELLPREQSHIKKYRQLNADGQSKVDEYTTDLVDSGKYASKENINTEDKAASVTDFKPAKKGKVLHGRAVAFGGATLKTEIDEDTAREIAELRKKLDEKQNNN